MHKNEIYLFCYSVIPLFRIPRFTNSRKHYNYDVVYKTLCFMNNPILKGFCVTEILFHENPVNKQIMYIVSNKANKIVASTAWPDPFTCLLN